MWRPAEALRLPMTTSARSALWAVRAPFAAALALAGALLAAHVAGLYLFTSGFLLQRVELNDVTPGCRAATSWTPPPPPRGAVDGDAAALDAWDAQLDAAKECTLPPRFDRVVVWIVDALRYDFLAEALGGADAPLDAHVHNVMTFPRTRAAAAPRSSLLAHFAADAPTTTLQRLKGLTTGSLPTFIEAGANFGGAGRIQEDTWLAQLRRRPDARRRVFVGDDTWQTVLDDEFDDVHPFSSFHVEDLHTVDAGVEAHMLDALERDDWSLLVAHSLGVDHVGHRFGPHHAQMHSKLTQMDRLARQVTERLRDDTLLVVLGDHGMSATGDHGGDTPLEVGSGVWMYAHQPWDSKRARPHEPLTADADVQHVLRTPTPTPAYVPFPTLPHAADARGHRSVPQIDLVPTLALLLGVPIPFSSLGAVIPEVFASTDVPLGALPNRLLRALRINARQVHTYLVAYAAHSSDLRAAQPELQRFWHAALYADAHWAAAPSADTARAAAAAYMAYVREALHRAQSVWAQFEYVRIVLGLGVLAAAVAASGAAAVRARTHNVADVLRMARRGAARGVAVGVLAAGVLAATARVTVGDAALAGVAGGAALGAALALARGRTAPAAPAAHRTSVAAGAVVLGHALLMAGNSFIMWEDRLTLATFAVLLLVRALRALNAPMAGWQQRLPLYALGALLLARLTAMSRVCREEQAPYCTPTFYAPAALAQFADNPAYAYAGAATNHVVAIGAAYVVALAMPSVLRRLLLPSQAHLGRAAPLLTWVVRPALMGAAGFWLADWAQGLEASQLDDELLLVLKVWVARAVLLLLLGGSVWWALDPLNLAVMQDQGDGTRPKVMILGFGNTFGSAFLLATVLAYVLFFLLAQPMGQLAWSACLVATVLLAELGDRERDAQWLARGQLEAARAAKATEAAAAARAAEPKLNRRTRRAQGIAAPPPPAEAPAPATPAPPPRPGVGALELVCVVLLGFVAFFGTGHQATLSAIQWRVAFVGFATVTYPWSPLWVTLNALAPLAALPVAGAALLVLWNVAPHRAQPPVEAPRMRLAADLTSALLGVLTYLGVLAWAAAAWACFFRRHLMLFKIWVPRFMTGGVAILAADVSVLVAIGAVWIIAAHTHRWFGTTFA